MITIIAFNLLFCRNIPHYSIVKYKTIKWCSCQFHFLFCIEFLCIFWDLIVCEKSLLVKVWTNMFSDRILFNVSGWGCAFYDYPQRIWQYHYSCFALGGSFAFLLGHCIRWWDHRQCGTLHAETTSKKVIGLSELLFASCPSFCPLSIVAQIMNLHTPTIIKEILAPTTLPSYREKTFISFLLCNIFELLLFSFHASHSYLVTFKFFYLL